MSASIARFRVASKHPRIEQRLANIAQRYSNFGVYPLTKALVTSTGFLTIEGIVRKTGFLYAVYGLRSEYCFVTPFGFFYNDSLFRDFADTRIVVDCMTFEITLLKCNV